MLCPPRACLHAGGEPQKGKVTCGGHPTYHVNVINLIKMRDYINRGVTPPKRVTSPPWGHPLPCKQALTPSDFVLTPGGNNSATTIKVNLSRTICRLSISLDTPSLPPTTKKKSCTLSSISLCRTVIPRKKITNKGYANLTGRVSKEYYGR